MATPRGARDGWRTAVEMAAMYTPSFSGAKVNRRTPLWRFTILRNFRDGMELILQTRLFAYVRRSRYGARRRRNNEESTDA